jgi:hypothetical protein
VAPAIVEERLDSLEARVMSLERLVAGIDDWRRETRILHEDVIGRMQLLGEGFAAQFATLTERLEAQDQKIGTLATRDEIRTLFGELNARLRALENRPSQG